MLWYVLEVENLTKIKKLDYLIKWNRDAVFDSVRCPLFV